MEYIVRTTLEKKTESKILEETVSGGYVLLFNNEEQEGKPELAFVVERPTLLERIKGIVKIRMIVKPEGNIYMRQVAEEFMHKWSK